MPIGIQTTALGTGLGVLYLDESGGYIGFTITASGYTSVHKVRVLPFTAGGALVYTAGGGGIEANVGQTADNLMALIKPLYDSGASGAVLGVWQVDASNDGAFPTPYTSTGADLFTAGTASGGPQPYWVMMTFAGHGAVGDRWQLHLPGMAASIASTFGRFVNGSTGTALNALQDYLEGKTNGPVHSAKTAIVTHAGEPIQSPTYRLLATNKRLRRRARVS